jgi:hypothetical protein
MTEKDVYTLAGQLVSASIILSEVTNELLILRAPKDTVKVVADAYAACLKIREALRKVSFEVENVGKDNEATS